MCTSYRVSVLVFVLLTSAVTSQGSFVKLGSLSDINAQDREETEKTMGSFSEVFRKKVSRTDSPPLSNSSTKSDQIHTVVLRRFTKEMGSLFVMLSVNTQCRELLMVTKTTMCNSSTLQNWTSLRMNVSKCSWHGKVKEQSKTCNRTAAIKLFQKQMGWVFESLPWPFKCNIVNLVAQSYRAQSQTQIISVHEVEDAIEKLFHFIHIRQQCSKARPEVFLPHVSLVDLKVKLNNGMTKETWLKNFITKGPQIYDLYLAYQQKSDKKRPLAGTSIRKPLPVDEVPLSQIYVNEVSEGVQQFSVVFGLKIKKKGQFRAMKSTYKIVSSLRNVKGDKLNAVLQAKVLQVELKNHQAANSSPSDGDDPVWTLPEVQRSKNLFPENLTDYYKQVSRAERCFIMFQISSSFGRNPRQMEGLYNALKHVIRRRSCYQFNRSGSGNTSMRPPVFGERETMPHTTRPASKYTDVSSKSTPFAEGQDQNEQPVEGGDSEGGVSSLEYALFILLGLLCIATLAFTINYALFALRRSPNHTNRYLPNGMLPSEVVRQNVVRERSHCVHVTHNNQYMAKQEQQLPFLCTKSSSMRYDSAVPCAIHSTPSFVLTSDLGPAGSGTDSGYSQSQETSAPSHNSGAMRNLHSDTELCSQISGNSKGIQPKTELSSEAETSTSPNPDASADLECRPTSEDYSRLDSSNTQSPPQEPQEEQMQCSVPGDSQNDEPCCTQSYETVFPEVPCETLHVVFDHGGIREVQV